MLCWHFPDSGPGAGSRAAWPEACLGRGVGPAEVGGAGPQRWSRLTLDAIMQLLCTASRMRWTPLHRWGAGGGGDTGLPLASAHMMPTGVPRPNGSQKDGSFLQGLDVFGSPEPIDGSDL